MIQNLQLINLSCPDDFFNQVSQMLKRQIKDRISGPTTNMNVVVVLNIDQNLGAECFHIEQTKENHFVVSGGDMRGVIYGVGHFLHAGHFNTDCFEPGDCCGYSVPKKSRRGIYLANPSWNYYGKASLDVIRDYLEDLMFWGCNTIMVILPKAAATSADAKAHQVWCEDVNRIKSIMREAKTLGMYTAAIVTANLSVTNPPAELLADWTGGHDGYQQNLAAHTHQEICPSKAGGLELILAGHKKAILEFQDSPPDILCIWPYDAGGCTCSKCKPWGGHGYLNVARALSALAKQLLPEISVMLSTWYFDHFTQGEWERLYQAIEPEQKWFDELMVHFSEEEGIPDSVQQAGILPGNLPAVDFPEISMYACVPWGGFGANPLPQRLENMWMKNENYLDGGFPYSEGIFDDLNKVICLQQYWGLCSVRETVHRYACYEFNREVADQITEAIYDIEAATSHVRIDEAGKQHVYPDPKVPWVGKQRFIISQTERIEAAFLKILQSEQMVPEPQRNGYRWRMLYLRAMCDYELLQHDFYISERCERALEELTDIYLAHDYPYHLSPPTRSSIAEARGIFTI